MLKSLNHQTSTSPSLIDGETERPRPQGEVEVVFSSWQATASLNRDWTKTHEMREMDAPIVAVGDRNVIPHDGSQSYTACGPGVAIALIWEPLFPHRGHFDLFELLQYPLRIKERTHMGPSGYSDVCIYSRLDLLFTFYFKGLLFNLILGVTMESFLIYVPIYLPKTAAP